MDRAFWQAITTNNFHIPPGFTLEQLTPELLSKLGESDPELRDFFIYTTLEKWIQQGLYDSDQLRRMITQLLSNLAYHLGEEHDDTVLLRSFSALTLSDVLKYEHTHPFLRTEEVLNILEQAISYLIREQDLRGYVEGKGWLHALAHAADLLGVLARNRFVQNAELERILTAVAEKVSTPTPHLYLTLEEERLALVAISALTRNLLPPSYWRWWCRQMAQIEETMQWENIVHVARSTEIAAYHNTKIFLHALYFQLTIAGYKLPAAQDLVEAIIKTLDRLDPGFYSVGVIKILDPDLNL
ncbi:MAG TPA: DUF2785 domain-containing protein [Ktedonobacteraceae bacterium]